MIRPAAVALAALVSCVPAQGAVQWRAWKDGAFQEAVDEAVRARKLVVLVVSQPDWCPPCIRLNQRWLANPADEVVAGLTKDALVMEVWAYDSAGADLLRRQDIRFQGTPTTFVIRPLKAGAPLGAGDVVGSIVGAPDDFPERLGRLLEGHDPVREARLAARQGSPLERGAAELALAQLLAARGAADEAERVLRQVEERGLGRKAAPELAKLAREAAWMRVAEVDLRVRKDYPKALAGIDAWMAVRAPEGAEAARCAYARAWALAKLGRVDEALRVMEASHLAEGTQDGYETFLYFCFRIASRETLAEGELRAREALLKFGESQGGLWEALGRIQRRQGRLADAKASFEKAIAHAPNDEDRFVFEGELLQVQRELAGATPG